MSTPRDARLEPADLALKLATADAVRVAGGQVFVAGELGRAQSVVSDWCSPNTASFMPIDMVRRVEALGAGAPGHPHLTAALARGAGVHLAGRTGHAAGMDDLGDWMASISRDHAELLAVLAGQDLAAACDALGATARAGILRETGDLITRLQQLQAALAGRGDSAPAVVPIGRRDSS